MYTTLVVIYVVCCLFLILVVLLQAGKGGGMGIGFGSSTSQTVFGGSGAGNFLSRLTAAAATIFIVLSLVLARMSSSQDSPRLRELAAEQAKSTAAESKSKDKLINSIEQAREEIQKNLPEGVKIEMQAPGDTPGEGAAPEGAPAVEGAAGEPPAAPAPAAQAAAPAGVIQLQPTPEKQPEAPAPANP